jgi:hypothetical protein
MVVETLSRREEGGHRKKGEKRLDDCLRNYVEEVCPLSPRFWRGAAGLSKLPRR